MSQDMVCEMCPETGICSVVLGSNAKLDLMPDEVAAIQDAGDDAAEIRAVIAESDQQFADTLTDEALVQLARAIR